MPTIVSKNWGKLTSSGHENAVDGAIVAFRGHLGIRQYIHVKPHKYGIKVWVHADSNNGYVCDFNIYTGKEGNRVEVGL